MGDQKTKLTAVDHDSKAMAPEPLTPEQHARIAHDQTLPYAVEVAMNVADTGQFGPRIEQAMVNLNARALAAGMQILNVSNLQTIVYDTKQGALVACMTILAQWIERDKLAALQRQQALTNLGPQRNGR